MKCPYCGREVAPQHKGKCPRCKAVLPIDRKPENKPEKNKEEK